MQKLILLLGFGSLTYAGNSFLIGSNIDVNPVAAIPFLSLINFLQYE